MYVAFDTSILGDATIKLMKSLLSIALFAALPVCAQTAAPAKPKPSTSAPKSSPAPAPAPAPVHGVPPATSMAAPAPSAPTVEPTKVVLTIGETKITAAEFNEFIDALPEQYRAQARGPMKRQVADQIARVKLLAAEARKRGLDKNKEVQSRIQFQTDNMLAGAVFNDMLEKTKVDDAAVQKYYQEHQNEYEQIQARHILIRFAGSPVPVKANQKDATEAEALAKAQETQKRLAAGEDFAKVAQEVSDDVGSGANGGDLGMFKRGSMVPAFEEVAFKLQPGQTSEPVKTQFGYHIIKVEKRDAKSMADVRAEIEAKVKPEIARNAVEELQKTSPIVLDEQYFGPVEAAPAKPLPPTAAPKP
jgi:peptidyl-prolyl cis-trans isomerase C